jgi:hypothetical protein
VSALARVALDGPAGDLVLGNDVISHLDAQLVSARRLLGVVLEQGAAIRRRDVEQVVQQAGRMQVEVQHRQLLERDRARLLERAGTRLGLLPGQVTLERLTMVMDPDAAERARARSAELRGLLAELQREHAVNRALLGQELAFLDHLMRLVGGESGSYDATGERPSSTPAALRTQRRVLDLEA